MEASELTAEPVPELDEAVVGDVLRRAARLGPDDRLLTAINAAGSDVRWTAAGLLRDADRWRAPCCATTRWARRSRPA